MQMIIELPDNEYGKLADKASGVNVSPEYYVGYVLWDYFNKMRSFKIIATVTSSIAGISIGAFLAICLKIM